MDTFKEQLVKIKSTPKTILLSALIWIAAIAITAVALLFLAQLAVLVAFLLFWGAIKLSKKLSIEYEYILTNGDLDVDKIMGQAERKRICSIKCSDIEAVGKYSPGMQLPQNVIVCCNPDDESYFLRGRDSKGNAVCIVIAPNEKMKEAIKAFIPRIIQRDAFAN